MKRPSVLRRLDTCIRSIVREVATASQAVTLLLRLSMVRWRESSSLTGSLARLRPWRGGVLAARGAAGDSCFEQRPQRRRGGTAMHHRVTEVFSDAVWLHVTLSTRANWSALDS